MHNDIETILLGREQIAARVAELARQIAGDLDALADHPTEIVLVPIMTGSMVFVADLIRHLPYKLRIGIMSVSSYPGRTMESKGALIRSSLPDHLAGKHVLIVDDILDTGQTLSLVSGIVAEQSPADSRICVLLRKQRDEAPAVEADYIGFEIPEAFVVGYGLDYNDYYRNLPDIVTLRPEAMQ